MKDPFKIVSLVILLIFSGLASHGQIVNPGFESWDTLYPHVYPVEMRLLGIPDAELGIPSGWNSESQFAITKTSDSYMGEKAMIVHHWYYYLGGSIAQKAPVDKRYDYLRGYYKLIEVSDIQSNKNFTGSISVVFLANDGVDTVASGVYFFSPAKKYTPFELRITPLLDVPPDSVTIEIKSINGACEELPVCNLLFVDDLELISDPVSGRAAPSADNFPGYIFPNPAKDVLYLPKGEPCRSYRIYDVNGHLCIEGKKDEILINNLKKGIYFIFIDLCHEKSWFIPFVKE